MTSPGLDNARLAVLVHELRSPVAALSAVAETIAESSAPDPARRELVRLAVAACRAIERIVMDVAVASVRYEAFHIELLVHDTVASHALRGSDVDLEAAEGRYLVDGDPMRLRQALDNLIVNALTYGGSTRVLVSVTGSEDAVRIAVSDTGPGIPARELAGIFDFGRRLSTASQGSGLGLTLARAIVDAHRGRLEVESEPGKGSTFTIVLPVSSSA